MVSIYSFQFQNGHKQPYVQVQDVYEQSQRRVRGSGPKVGAFGCMNKSPVRLVMVPVVSWAKFLKLFTVSYWLCLRVADLIRSQLKRFVFLDLISQRVVSCRHSSCRWDLAIDLCITYLFLQRFNSDTQTSKNTTVLYRSQLSSSLQAFNKKKQWVAYEDPQSAQVKIVTAIFTFVFSAWKVLAVNEDLSKHFI